MRMRTHSPILNALSRVHFLIMVLRTRHAVKRVGVSHKYAKRIVVRGPTITGCLRTTVRNVQQESMLRLEQFHASPVPVIQIRPPEARLQQIVFAIPAISEILEASVIRLRTTVGLDRTIQWVNVWTIAHWSLEEVTIVTRVTMLYIFNHILYIVMQDIIAEVVQAVVAIRVKV